MKKKLVILILLLFIISGCSSKEEKVEIKKVTCEEMKELIKEEALLIDVRTKEEYDEYHLDQAVNIEYQNIIEGAKKYSIVDNDKIIVYCKSGVRSNTAAQSLVDNGFKHVYDLGAITNCPA